MAEHKGDNQKLKMLYILKLFSEETDDEHSLTMPEIIKKLEAYGVNADRKTLYKDFDELKKFGIDLIAERDGKGFKYYLGSREFELPELKLLVDSVQSAKFITDRKTNQLIKKLESSVSKYQASQLHRQVITSGRIKTMNESIYYNVDTLNEAISNNKQISFNYYDWNIKKEMELRYGGRVYKASPWALVCNDEKYYLIAHDPSRNKITHYRVDKMMKICVLKDAREGQDEFRNFNIAKYENSLFGMYGGDETKVTLEAENGMVGVLIDRFGKDIIIVPKDDDHFQTVVNVSVSNHFLGWIISLDGRVQVVGPDSVVKQMQELVEKLQEQYL